MRTEGHEPIVDGEASVVTPVVAIVEDAAAEPRALLADVLERSELWCRIEEARAASGVPIDAFKVLIKPDFEAFSKGSACATDPRLVEALVDLLAERGFTSVAVAEAVGPADRFLGNRDVLAIADLLGYRFVTDAGNTYDVIDLSEDVTDAGFGAEHALRGSNISRAFREAHYRIGFAKLKTHPEDGYALSLHNLVGALPLRDKTFHYRHRIDRADAALEMLRHYPFHFNIVDAIVSSDGSFGGLSPRPRPTATLIAGSDALLVDWAAAAKMGVDPHCSPLDAKALETIGLPPIHEVRGSLAPWPSFKNTHPLVGKAMARLAETPALSRAIQEVIPKVDRSLFPFKDPRADALNNLLSPLYARADDDPLVFASLAALHWQLAAADDARRAWAVMVDKDSIPRKALALDLDLERYSPSDYEDVIGYLAPLERLVCSTEPDAFGMRHRYVDESIVFEFEKVLGAPYARFVERVPIERSVQLMNDWIGGCSVPVRTDAEGRVVYQAERTMFLPQPNFVAFYGGKPIDVAKLEVVKRDACRQSIHWKTVKSSNESAGFDDGSVTFAETSDGRTRVTIVARQRFTLPLYFQAVRLDLYPEVKNAIELEAYRTYFDSTMNNFEACYEGRSFQVGHDENPRSGEPGEPTESPFALLERLVKMFGLDQKSRGRAIAAFMPQMMPRSIDDRGFEHFAAEDTLKKPVADEAKRAATSMFGAAATFFRGVATAIAGDLGRRK